MFICPQPHKWHDIFRELEGAWKKAGKIGVRPPTPLILAGWNYSNDIEKAKRWKDTVHWAEENNLGDLIPEFTQGESYIVDEPSTYEISPMGSPMKLPWDFEKKIKPSQSETKEALEKLKKNWVKIVGSKLGSITSPLCFTGRKKRRLLVLAKQNTEPPWGTWTELYYDGHHRFFTYFRKAINDSINPLHVDHIDFEVSKKFE